LAGLPAGHGLLRTARAGSQRVQLVQAVLLAEEV